MAPSASCFPIPSTLQDLEREPYNLLPYPDDFNDDDDEARDDSFSALVRKVEHGNRYLTMQYDQQNNSGDDEDEEEDEQWMEEGRLQAIYTLVRKSASLKDETRDALVSLLCQAVKLIASSLNTISAKEGGEAVPQSFRDVFSCHMYMLYSLMFLLETNQGDAKVQESNERDMYVQAMLYAAQAMSECRQTLWQRGVADEAVILLPCRMVYPLLERATGVQARKAIGADDALQILAVTLYSTDSALSTITAALMDLMHSFEHMAPMVAELCTMVTEQPINRLAVELLREMGRLDGNDTKGNGVKFVAPFLPALAQVRPRLVLQHLTVILPHLQAETYYLRSALVQAIAHVLEYLGKNEMSAEHVAESPDGAEVSFIHNSSNSTKSRDALLQILAERVYDVTSFTRGATLKAWANLVMSNTLPKEMLLPVTKLAIDRLQDKTVVARKQAMVLLTMVLENNPFMGSLDPKPYNEKMRELYDYVKENMPADVKEAYKGSLEAAGDDPRSIFEAEQAALAAALEEAEIMLRDTPDELTEAQQTYCTKVQALKYTQSAIEFIELFEEATVALEGMLLSVNNSDVTEALHFFVQARHFQLPCAVTGMKRALALMWSTETAIRDEVLKAFIEVFLAQPGSEGSTLLPPRQIAKNLLILTNEATVSELASIEEAIQRLVKDSRIPEQVFLILWSIAKDGSGDFRAAALHLLAMAASADRSLIDSKSRLKLLLDAGLGEYTRERKDWKLAKAAAIVLQRVGRAKVDPTDAKYLVLEHIIEELCEVARGEWCDDKKTKDTLAWFSTAEETIKALFVISPEPETICREIIIGMSAVTFQDGYTDCNPLRLARFFHVLGHVALHLLVYTEGLSSVVRRANALKSLKKQEDVGKKKSRNQQRSVNDSSGSEEDAMEAELGMDAAIEADNERQLTDITEQEIIGRGIIGVYGPLLVRVVGNEGGAFASSNILMQASMLTLCKFMCVSGSFCEKHLPLLFTGLANAPPEDTTTRANTVVALGDLAFRFPNEVEPYTPRFYACLRDSSTKVRRHTLMVLTHLILNDMVKVKGQVCEIAICLQDNDLRIRDMARLLFHELSKRSNNPIYNLLPDIISQLSQLSMKKEDFRGIMSFLLGYIKKERQCEMLCEKLCQRYPNCKSTEQKGDLTYCIAQLKMTERMIKYLAENFKLYKDALHDTEVNKHMFSILSKARKLGKPELRQHLDSWEAHLNEVAKIGAENEAADKKASSARTRAKKKASKKSKLLQVVEEDELDIQSDNEAMDDEEAIMLPRSSKKPSRMGKKTAKVIDDEDDELEFASGESSPMPHSNNKASRKGKKKVKVIDDDEDDDENEFIDKENDRQILSSSRSSRRTRLS
ncbi:hypothetical protein MPSEU_000437500 [Mayamaea pseudoterrestris]|nr:hypothetical protein MPSEU_000437500 [Mayamaea pseudoterrestris]